jgi:hypothetical protein
MDSSRTATARHELLTLHRALIEAARVDLERVEGRLTANEMLDRLMTDDRLAWLRPLTELIVGLDEALEGETPDDAPTHIARARNLLLFASEYARLLHDRPEVTMAHGATMRAFDADRSS